MIFPDKKLIYLYIRCIVDNNKVKMFTVTVCTQHQSFQGEARFEHKFCDDTEVVFKFIKHEFDKFITVSGDPDTVDYDGMMINYDMYLDGSVSMEPFVAFWMDCDKRVVEYADADDLFNEWIREHM